MYSHEYDLAFKVYNLVIFIYWQSCATITSLLWDHLCHLRKKPCAPQQSLPISLIPSTPGSHWLLPTLLCIVLIPQFFAWVVVYWGLFSNLPLPSGSVSPSWGSSAMEGGTEPKLHSPGGCAHHGPGVQRDLWEPEVKAMLVICYRAWPQSLPDRNISSLFFLCLETHRIWAHHRQRPRQWSSREAADWQDRWNHLQLLSGPSDRWRSPVTNN